MIQFDKLNSRYIPEMALIVYKSDNYEVPTYYLESGEFHLKNKSYILKETTPLQINQLNDLASFLNQREYNQQIKFKGLINHDILYVENIGSEKNIIFKIENTKKKLYFDSSLNIKEGFANLPNLIFNYNQNILYVYAYQGELHENTQLYYAPFHNVNDDHTVCLGTLNIDDELPYWEDLQKTIIKSFFNTMFTYFLDNPCKSKYNLNSILNRCITRNEEFPFETLKKSKFKLKDILP